MAGFDIDDDLVRKLSALLDETGLTEIEFAEGERRIRVCKTVQMVSTAQQFATIAAEKTVTASVEPDTLADHPGAVIAPMVGTVYAAPEPGADPFVSLGDRVA